MTVRRAAEVTRNQYHASHQPSSRVSPAGKGNSGTWKKLELPQLLLSIKNRALNKFFPIKYHQELDPEKSPRKSLEIQPKAKDTKGFRQNMLSNKMIINDPVMEINVKDPGLILKKQLENAKSSPLPQKITLKKTSSIKDKISVWEGKRETQSPILNRKESVQVKRQDSFGTAFGDTNVDDGRIHQKGSIKRMFSWEMDNKELERKDCITVEKKADKEINPSVERLQEQVISTKKDQATVLSQVKRFERSLKDGPADGLPQLPGTYYSPQCLLDSEIQENRVGSKLKWGSDSENSEPIFGRVGEGRRSRRTSNAENVYTEPGAPEKKLPINPLPKPRRTFRHEGEVGPDRTGLRKFNRDLPPLPCIPPPPLPTSPPPSAVSRRLWNSKHRNNGDHRKSYEFEDLLQSSENGRVDWYAQTKLALTRTLSEENVYEDILDPPSKENPYEDIETDSRSLGKKSVSAFPGTLPSLPGTISKAHQKSAFFRQNSERRSFKLLDIRKLGRDGVASPSKLSPPSSPSSPDDNFFSTGDQQNGRRRRKIPKLVMRINSIYEARRGKKRVKRLYQATENSSGRVTDDNSESDSDTEEKLKAHSQRLVHVKSRVSLTPRYQTLDLIEYQERQLFEYFVVISLQKKATGTVYVPEITQQFPLKLERSFKFMREAGDQFKAIPQFCFPDAKDWAPVGQFDSETFSFVLTGEDGSRRFGYCRRLLPSGKGNRLPEVYCIVSRLGCFNLFSKILDEVEKRRGLSPALVQPFMRAIIDAPFPALGKKISVKNFLPGSGTEVIELCRPLDSRLEHVDFEALFSTLSVRHLIQVFASLLLERRVIFMADTLSTLSKCCHAMVALIYPFTWQHTYIPVLPPAMIDIVCSPTPFLIGLLSNSLPRLKDMPVEEVLLVDLVNNRFLRQMDDEDSILPRKLQAALEQILEQRNEMASELDQGSANGQQDSSSMNDVISEAFVRFFVEIVGHYSLFMAPGEQDERSLRRDTFRKSISSKSVRRFLEVFMETQMFGGFSQEREMRKQGSKGLFEVRAQEYLETLPGGEQSGVNKFFNRIGSKMRFLHKK
ncbi:DENN domain-containing protein 2A [Mixophyes fleayi]|uniref:DENN domain-containing protein 2A n=1 Tax=Mixophyes fleayi TaxID=3061075 RepID=UPI003F4E2D6B